MSSSSATVSDNALVSWIPSWPNCHPDAVVKCMASLDHNADPAVLGSNETAFNSSYPVWDEMSPGQKDKCVTWFARLNADVQEAVLKQSREMGSEAVHKNDLARLLHLRKEPVALSHWSRLERPLTRRQLVARYADDAPNLAGTDSLASETDAWSRLAAIFNDYTVFTPQNELIKYINVQGTPTPVMPYEAAEEDVTCLAAHCHDLNPTDLSRRSIMRDSGWIKDQWSHMKAALTVVFAEFDRSGQNFDRGEAETEWRSPEECKRWVHLATNGTDKSFPSVCCYAYGILDRSHFDNLGFLLPKGVGRDCSILPIVLHDGNENCSVSANQALSKQQLRGNKKRKRTNTKDRNSDNDGKALAAIRSTMIEIAAEDRKMECLKILFTVEDDPDLKARAKSALIELSGL